MRRAVLAVAAHGVAAWVVVLCFGLGANGGRAKRVLLVSSKTQTKDGKGTAERRKGSAWGAAARNVSGGSGSA